LGTTFDPLGAPLPFVNGIPPLGSQAGGRDSDALEGINLSSGYAALDYNFGELAIVTSKTDFIRPLTYRRR
jgi:hypothetical protein